MDPPRVEAQPASIAAVPRPSRSIVRRMALMKTRKAGDAPARLLSNRSDTDIPEFCKIWGLKLSVSAAGVKREWLRPPFVPTTNPLEIK
jgi:hypothetical protein